MCGTKRCLICYKENIIEAEHSCSMLPGRYEEKWNAMATLCFQATTTKDECSECFKASPQECKLHAGDQVQHNKPQICVILAERTKRGAFDRYTFGSQSHELKASEMYSRSAYTSKLYEDVDCDTDLAPGKQNDQKMKIFKKLENKPITSLSVAEKVIREVVNWQNTTFVAFGRECLIYLVKAFLDNNISPDILSRGRNIISLEIKSINLRFVNIQNFLEEENIHAYISVFKLQQIKPYFFPNTLTPEKAARMGEQLPDREYFSDFLDTPEIIKEKDQFWNYFKSSGLPWNYSKQLLRKAINDSYILTEALCSFAMENFDFQKKLSSMLSPVVKKKDNQKEFIHPFSSCVSTPQLFFRIFKLFCDMTSIAAVKGEFTGAKKAKVSKYEYEWLSYLQKTETQQIQTAFSSTRGQKHFPGIGFPDGYLVAADGKKTAFEFLGCFFHGHKDSMCPFTKGKDWESATARGKSLNDRNSSTEKRNNDLKEHPEVDQLICIYECEWKNMAATDPDVASFLSTLSPHPLRRLVPRVSCLCS